MTFCYPGPQSKNYIKKQTKLQAETIISLALLFLVPFYICLERHLFTVKNLKSGLYILRSLHNGVPEIWQELMGYVKVVVQGMGIKKSESTSRKDIRK